MEETDPNIHSTMLSTKVHDCKNMLGVCLLQVDSIIEKEPNNTKLADLASSLYVLNNEISDILYHHQLYANKLSLNTSENYIKDTISEQITYAKKIKNRKDIEFQVICDDDLEWKYDEIIMGAVLRNIFLNAIQYANKSVAVYVSKEKGSLIIKTIDDGPGIELTNKAKGVGLILINDLIKIHSKSVRTNISFRSNINVGVEVVIEISG